MLFIEVNVGDGVHHVVRARSGRRNMFFAPSEGCAGAGVAGVTAGWPGGPGRSGLPHGPIWMGSFFFFG